MASTSGVEKNNSFNIHFEVRASQLHRTNSFSGLCPRLAGPQMQSCWWVASPLIIMSQHPQVLCFIEAQSVSATRFIAPMRKRVAVLFATLCTTQCA